MLQRLLDTESISGGQWLVVIALSLVAPGVVVVGSATNSSPCTSYHRQRTPNTWSWACASTDGNGHA